MTGARRYGKNVFELWRDGGHVLPFPVVRHSWNPEHSWFLVERIEVGKWPYGKAWGRFAGVGLEEPLSCAGCFQWQRSHLGLRKMAERAQQKP